MSRKHKVLDPDKPYFVTITVVEWVDVFTRLEYKEIVVESLKFCQSNKGLEIFSWVIMTNHLHLIVRAQHGLKLGNIIRDFKKFTSVKLCKAILDNKIESRKWMLEIFSNAALSSKKHFNYQFWQESYHPVELSDNFTMNQKLEYLHNNPVKAGFVESPEFYQFSSAKDYYTGQPGLIDIIFIE